MKYRRAMRRSKRQKPPSLYLPTAIQSQSSRESSPRCSSVLSDWDADDEGFMSSAEFLPARPLSVAIPAGPYCPRRPTLQEVLSNSAPPPWTLSAFMAYLSQNHCLETLEFTMDASRYRKHYTTMIENSQGAALSAETNGCSYVRMLWQKLLDAYITPNGPREVNLPSDVRDTLLALPNHTAPPHPSVLDAAVRIIYELMDESVLVPFLNSVAPFRGQQNYSSPWTSSDEMPDVTFAGGASLDDRSLSPIRSHTRRDQSPPSDVVQASYAGPSPRLSHHSHLSAALGRSASSRLSAYLSNSSAVSSASDAQEGALTDDSASSPSNSALEPMTPPTTPPTSDAGFMSPGTSPRSSRTEGSGWKKMGAKLGWKKSRSGHGSGSSTRSGKSPVVREAVAEDDATL
jgi:hypothetical protein